MKYILILTTFLLAFFYSCKKKDDMEQMCETLEENPEENTSFSIPSTPGSYWVYSIYGLDSNGQQNSSFANDTVRLIGDTIINDLEFQKYSGLDFFGSQELSFRRESNGIIYNELGEVIYSYTNFNQEFDVDSIEYPQNDYIRTYRIMRDRRDESLEVPFGLFSCIDEEKWHYYEGFPEVNECGDTALVFHNYYSDEIGLVKAEVAFIGQAFANCATVEKVLIDFQEP